MAFPESSVVEDFNGADSGSLPGWVGDTFAFGGSDFARTSNVADPNGLYSEASRQTVIGPDGDVYVTAPQLIAVGGDFGVHLRVPPADVATANATGYRVGLYRTGSSAYEYRFYRKDVGGTGALVQLGSAISVSWAAGNKIGARILGSTLRAYRHDGTSWAEIGNRTDSTYGGSGYAGMWVFANGGAFTFEDFGAGTLASGTTYDRAGTLIVGP